MEKKLILLNVPFISKHNPYPAIPQLAEYLSKKGIEIEVCDINFELWKRFLNEENYRAGVEYSRERFLQLNSKPFLTFKECVEYRRLSLLLSNKIPDYNSAPEELKIALSQLKFFPNMYIGGPIKKLCSPFSEFSSKDILESVDFDFFYCPIIKRILAEKIIDSPLLIGISVIFKNQVLPGFFIAKVLKELFPKTHITMGGPYISLHFRELSNPNIFKIVDSFILDEGEIPLETLYKILKNGKSNYKEVPNLIWFNGKKIVKNKICPTLPLNSLTKPYYEVLPFKEYKKSGKVVFSLRLSKGCFWRRCSFCRTTMYFCKDYYQPDFNSVFDVIYEIYKKYKPDCFLFSDEAVHPDLLKFISKNIIKYKLNFKWFTHTRFHPKLNRKLFSLMKDANCEHITLGMESYSNRILRLMKKGINTQLIDRVITENNGIINLKVYMIIGFPTETEEEAINSFNYVNSLKKKGLLTEYIYSIFNIVYGCDIWNNPENYGVTTFKTLPGEDLAPDIFNFECKSGMDRKKVTDLYSKFYLLNFIQGQIKKNTVYIDSKEINLNFSIPSVNQIILKNLFGANYLPYVKWLESVEEKLTK